MSFVAVCQYPGRAAFRFHSEEFHVERWSDLDAVGREVVARAWAAISTHPAPPIVDYLPGALVYVSGECDGR